MTTPYFDSQASAHTILGDERLEPDLLLPTQWYARARTIQEPEARLLFAIFETAWNDLGRPRRCSWTRAASWNDARRSAAAWFAHPNYRGPGFNLTQVCDYFGWDADTVREAARLRLSLSGHGRRENAPGLAPAAGGQSLSGSSEIPQQGCSSQPSPTSQDHAGNRPAVNGEPLSGPDPCPTLSEGTERLKTRACGHPFTFANTYRRGCLICHRVRARNYKRKISVPSVL